MTCDNKWHVEWDDYPFATRHDTGERMEIDEIERRLNEHERMIAEGHGPFCFEPDTTPEAWEELQKYKRACEALNLDVVKGQLQHTPPFVMDGFMIEALEEYARILEGGE